MESLEQRLQKTENTSKKRWPLWIALAILVVLLLSGGMLLYLKYRATTVPTGGVVTDVPLSQVEVPPMQVDLSNTVNPLSLAEQQVSETQVMDLTVVAEPFLERYGSYNNQDGFLNWSEIEIYMTTTLADYVFGSYEKQLTAQMPTVDAYYAINTKVIASELTSIDDEKGTAELQITTQRQEVAAGGVQTRVYYQDARVTLSKVDGLWKVSGVYWGAEK